MRLAYALNGANVEHEARADETLLVVLRRRGIGSVRETCGIGVCGACTVLLDGELVAACILLAPLVAGRTVTTAEGLAPDHPVKRAFVSAHAYQCGYCVPGMVLTAARLLEELPDPTETEIREALAGNLCRCGSYVKMIEAVRCAAGEESMDQ
jgi:aerobic-type carbon monoxide dehydrogenase small subunit (CoxS/CutS family)